MANLDLETIEEQSKLFANNATAVSAWVEEADAFLCGLPGKVKAEVTGKSGTLLFTKGARGWGLFYDTLASNTDKDITSFYLPEAPFAFKAEGAILIPQLLEVFHRELISIIAKCDAAIDVLQSMPALSAREG